MFIPINQEYLTGRRVMLWGVILLAVTQLCGFRSTADPTNLPRNWSDITTFAPAWVWITGWSVTLVMAVVELSRGRGRWAITAAVGMTAATAATYLVSYVLTVAVIGWGSREWSSFGKYAAYTLIIIGLLIKVGALKPWRSRDDG